MEMAAWPRTTIDATAFRELGHDYYSLCLELVKNESSTKSYKKRAAKGGLLGLHLLKNISTNRVPS